MCLGLSLAGDFPGSKGRGYATRLIFPAVDTYPFKYRLANLSRVEYLGSVKPVVLSDSPSHSVVWQRRSFPKLHSGGDRVPDFMTRQIDRATNAKLALC